MAHTKQKKINYKSIAKTRSRGFTLIEVLVALSIIAISLGAILSTSGSQANQAAYLKQKTIAHWIAMNEITKLQIEKQWPSIGEEKGSTEMANHKWFWLRTVKEAQGENLRQVKYQVYIDNNYKSSLSNLIGYVSKT